MRMLMGILLLLAALAVAALGALWTIFAIVGTEWDYCPDNDCIAGEFMGLSLLAVGAAAGWAGSRLARGKQETPKRSS
jgi:hypothetical protein